MKNFFTLFLLFLTVSCGSGYVDSGKVVPKSKFPLVYNVTREKYIRYKRSFDHVESVYKSKSGVPLITFVPSDKDPKFEKTSQAYANLAFLGNENWVVFKEEADEFNYDKNKWSGLFSGEVDTGRGIITLNVETHVSSYNRIKKVLQHEVGHALGFDHTSGLDYSTMNDLFTNWVPTLTRYDRRRLHDKYPFSTIASYEKDLEKIGAISEREKAELISDNLVENFGLSEERSFEVASTLNHMNKVKNKRSLTNNDWDIVTKKLFGFDYQTGKKALENHIKGESENLDSLIEKAALKNNTTPEHVQELISDYLL